MKNEARIRALAHRYEECLTSEHEEQELRTLLAEEEHLADDLKGLALMFSGLEALKEEQMPARIHRPQRGLRRGWWQWAVAAAAVVGLILTADYLHTPYCYINGQAIYDSEEALAYTDCLAQLEHLDYTMDLFDALLIPNN